MSYKNLEVWKLAKDLTVVIHHMTLKLPKFEQYEEGSQIRRSIKSVRANIVEGYGRRFYKNEFIRFIIFALASNDETTEHLEILFETGSLSDKKLYESLKQRVQKLGKMLNSFLHAVQKHHFKIDNPDPK
jgi:four helix bundle protein